MIYRPLPSSLETSPSYLVKVLRDAGLEKGRGGGWSQSGTDQKVGDSASQFLLQSDKNCNICCSLNILQFWSCLGHFLQKFFFQNFTCLAEQETWNTLQPTKTLLWTGLKQGPERQQSMEPAVPYMTPVSCSHTVGSEQRSFLHFLLNGQTEAHSFVKRGLCITQMTYQGTEMDFRVSVLIMMMPLSSNMNNGAD